MLKNTNLRDMRSSKLLDQMEFIGSCKVHNVKSYKCRLLITFAKRLDPYIIIYTQYKFHGITSIAY